MTSIQDFYDSIYNAPPGTPHCSHCGRPLLLVRENGKTWLYCKRCADLLKEEGLSTHSIASSGSP